jgi:HlyD family secretion protein
MKKILNLKSRLVIIGIALVIVVAMIAGGILVFNSPQAPLPNVVPIRRGDISASVNATGKVRSKKTANLSLPMSGVIAKIEKYQGDDSKPGDIILSLRADEAARRLKQAELLLMSRQLDLAQAKATPRDEDIEIARANLKKATLSVAVAESNYNSNPTTQNEAYRESARADLDIARASFNRLTNGVSKEQLDALQNSITSAQIDLDSAKLAMTQTQLTVPFTSTITDIAVREGELYGGYGTLASVADLSVLEIIADVDEIDVANVKVGQSVDVRLDAFPGEKFTGKLMRLYPSATPQRGSTVYSALIDFDLHGIQVRPGMGANLKIQTVEKKNVLLVPNRAIKNVGTRKAVRVLAPGDPRDVIVETGVTDGVQTEIVSGVNEGDVVQIN